MAELQELLDEWIVAVFSDRLKIDLCCDLVFHVAYMSVTYACARKPCHRSRAGSHGLRKMTGISAAGWTGGLCSLGSVSSGQASNSSGIQVADCLRRNKVLVRERACSSWSRSSGSSPQLWNRPFAVDSALSAGRCGATKPACIGEYQLHHTGEGEALATGPAAHRTWAVRRRARIRGRARSSRGFAAPRARRRES